MTTDAKSTTDPTILHHAFDGDRDLSVATITPEEAQKLLETAMDATVDEKAVETYAQIMEADSWLMNGMPIIISESGQLLDGVQRLTACVRVNKPFVTVVARNVRSDILHTIDQHRRRTYQGVLESRGIEDAGTITRMMSKLIRIENGSLGREPISISWSRYDRVLEANPELHEAVKISNRFNKSTLHSTSRPVLCYMALRAGKRDELERFLQQLTYHHNEGIDSPARMFNLQLNMWATMDKNNRKQGKIGNSQHIDSVLAHAILHFNSYVKGEKLNGPLNWTPDYGTRNVVRVLNGEEVTERVSATELDFDRTAAPANLGLPMMDGYPGLREGNFDRTRHTDDLVGAIADIVHTGAARGSHDAQIQMMTVTPEMASLWLSPKINRNNRKTQRNHVAAIARDIKNGNWMMNAQPICFTKDPMADWPEEDGPRLLNGQHRLLAIRDAGEAVEIPIAYNIPEEAFATYDTHAKRTLRKTGPRADDRVLVAAARFQYKEDHGYPLSSNDMPTLTTSELLEVLHNHPHLADNFPLARRAGMAELGSAGVMTYFIYRVKREEPDLSEDFLNKIESGLNITETSDPAGKLRRELAKSAQGPRSRTRKEQIEALISHWNAYKRWIKDKQKPSKSKVTEQQPVKEVAEVQDDLF